MPQIIVLPHVELCPQGKLIRADTGVVLIEALLSDSTR